MECSLPMDGRRVSLTQLSKDSFRECQATLTLTDLLIIIFSGISVSVVAIMTSFFLASTVHCFQRWSKGTKGDEEESEEWEGCTYFEGPVWSCYFKPCKDTAVSVCDMWPVSCCFHLVNIQDCLTVGSCPGTVAVVFWFCFVWLHMDIWTMVTKDVPEESARVPVKLASALLHSQNNIIEIILLAVWAHVLDGYWLRALCNRPTQIKWGHHLQDDRGKEF